MNRHLHACASHIALQAPKSGAFAAVHGQAPRKSIWGETSGHLTASEKTDHVEEHSGFAIKCVTVLASVDGLWEV